MHNKNAISRWCRNRPRDLARYEFSQRKGLLYNTVSEYLVRTKSYHIERGHRFRMSCALKMASRAEVASANATWIQGPPRTTPAATPPVTLRRRLDVDPDGLRRHWQEATAISMRSTIEPSSPGYALRSPQSLRCSRAFPPGCGRASSCGCSGQRRLPQA